MRLDTKKSQLRLEDLTPSSNAKTVMQDFKQRETSKKHNTTKGTS